MNASIQRVDRKLETSLAAHARRVFAHAAHLEIRSVAQWGKRDRSKGPKHAED